jgi:hypothetical protein
VREAVAAGEVVGEHEHVGTGAVELVRELGDRRRRGDHRQVVLGIEESSQARQHGGMIIKDCDAEHSRPVWDGRRPHAMGLRSSARPAATGFAARRMPAPGALFAAREPTSRLDEPAPDRVAGEFDSVAHSELLQDVRAMAFDGLLGDVQHLADLVVGVRFGD